MLYILMPDRFSDGNEKDHRDLTGNPVATHITPPFRFEEDAHTADQAATESTSRHSRCRATAAPWAPPYRHGNSWLMASRPGITLAQA